MRLECIVLQKRLGGWGLNWVEQTRTRGSRPRLSVPNSEGLSGASENGTVWLPEESREAPPTSGTVLYNSNPTLFGATFIIPAARVWATEHSGIFLLGLSTAIAMSFGVRPAPSWSTFRWNVVALRVLYYSRVDSGSTPAGA